MFIEFEVVLKEQRIDWEQLGFKGKHDTLRRCIRVEDAMQLQELSDNVQGLFLTDGTMLYIVGKYEELRDNLIHIDSENNTEF